MRIKDACAGWVVIFIFSDVLYKKMITITNNLLFVYYNTTTH